MNRRELLLNAPVSKALLTLAIPIVLANILQTAYSFIDLFWVGRLGTEAVAALGAGFPLIFFFMALAIGLVSAGSILIAQFNGKHDQENVSLLTAQTLSFILLVIFGLVAIGQLLVPLILPFLAKDAAVLALAQPYLRIALLSLIPMFLFTVAQSALRSVGEVRLPFFVVLFTVILNYFLDPLFMNGWKFIPAMGIAGVAWVTVLTNTLSALLGLLLLFQSSQMQLHPKQFIPQKKWMKKLLQLGIPTSLEMSSRSLGSLLVTGLAASFGTVVLAAFSLGGQVFGFVIIPAVGLAIAVSALVGNNLGAKQENRVKKTVHLGMLYGFVFLTLLGILLFFLAPAIVNFFAPGEIELVTQATQFIRIMALSFGFIGAQMAVVGALRAAGRTFLAMLMALSQVVVLFVSAFVLSRYYGQTGIWIAYVVSNILSFAIALYFYWRKDWLSMKN